MPKFPTDAALADVIKVLLLLGFKLVREGNHIAKLRQNSDGSMTIPNHTRLKCSTLRTILTQSGISREDFIKAYKSELGKGIGEAIWI